MSVGRRYILVQDKYILVIASTTAKPVADLETQL